MKIVINKCFGGFGLSDAVYKKLIELGVPNYKSFEEIPDNNEPYIVENKKIGLLGRYSSNFRDDDKRSHPLLIQAIEEVGIEKASGSLAEIRIVKIPDDVQFEIDDYDGVETVHEIHSSW